MNKKACEIGIDHPMMVGAKGAFDSCMRAAVTRAISTGSDEGSATLRISFEIMNVMDEETGEGRRMPLFKYKAGFNVPMKESIDATIAENSTLIHNGDGWNLIAGQVSMDELMAEEDT